MMYLVSAPRVGQCFLIEHEAFESAKEDARILIEHLLANGDAIFIREMKYAPKLQVHVSTHCYRHIVGSKPADWECLTPY